ncbi:uncharacterized protein LOC17891160 [Capsella rubella]|uniref:uncharacterized protein LOC17891160 n=1 Tax=Capsella rubella TaxID=81985 RepID=UPI000CD584B4|nr:uncharacterized protein LOC17891160 [Capsella rubella]
MAMGKVVEMPCLDHNLSRVTFGVEDKPSCDGCGGTEGVGLACKRCNLQAHEECIEWSLKFAGHSNHHLRKVSPETLDYTNGKCHLCGEIPSKAFYHCSICDFSIDEYCKINGRCSVFDGRSHKHPFILLPRQISFICNACGLVGECNPYVCIECNLMIHRDCIDLPRIININRHDHRISLTYHLGRGNWEPCGVCRKKIDWSIGAFYCKRCPNYAVHSKCATKFKVWDMKELEDVPEKEEKIKDPYEEINGEKEIIHFSHEQHNLILCEDRVVDSKMIHCFACFLPIYDDMYYKCVQCDFFHPLYLTLEESKSCVACGLHSPNVLSCIVCDFALDINCATLPAKVKHRCDDHFLSLCLGGNNGTGELWCDICETKTDPKFCKRQHHGLRRDTFKVEQFPTVV